jgi:competence ComEA-like helix-hairpin-helix protein
MLLIAGAVLIGWQSRRPRLVFTDQPPAQTQRVRQATDRIDPNTASAASMVRLSGIGPTRAASIIEYRDSHGPESFKTADDLDMIRGIGPGTIRRIAPDLSLPQ